MKKLLSLFLALAMAVSAAGCTAAPSSTSSETTETASSASETESASEVSVQESTKPTTDPSGATVEIPDTIDSIVCLSPAVNEVLVALGMGDKIVAYDTQSVGLEGLSPDLPALDMLQPDMEMLASFQPDVLFVSNMTLYDQSNPFQQLLDMGVCVLCVPSANSIADIQSSIAFIAAAVGKTAEGDALIAEMQTKLDQIEAVGKTITEKKSVYFEIGAAPNMYSFGSGVFLNEMIELIGAENILADQEGWLAVEGETVAAANPDVILTNVNYLEDATGEILARSGWEGVAAIQNGDVYYIDNMSSSLSNHNIVKALDQMAKAVYPEEYGA